jgi:hypothetical protein
MFVTFFRVRNSQFRARVLAQGYLQEDGIFENWIHLELKYSLMEIIKF